MRIRKFARHAVGAVAAAGMLVAGGVALAGTTTATNTKYASEAFKAATLVSPGALNYTYTSPNGNVNVGVVVYFQVRLTNAVFSQTGTISVGGTTTGVTSALSADNSTLQVTYTAPAATALGVNALVLAANTALTATTALGTPGATIGAQVNFSTVAATASQLQSTGTLPASGDGVTASVPWATTGQAITVATSNLGTLSPAYTNKIDLGANPTSSNYTTPGQISLGSVTIGTTTTPWKIAADGTTNYDWTRLNAGTMATVAVAPGASQSFPIGSVLKLDTTANAACTGTLAGSTQSTVVTANASVANTLSIPYNANTAPVTYFVCMSNPSAGNIATPITATLTATTVPGTVSTDLADSGTGTGYAVINNGQSATVRNYIPAAVTGYIQTIRVINTGSLTTAVNVSVIDDVTGAVTSPATPVIASLVPGAAVRLSQAQIEAVTGAIAATQRPRLRFTAQTNGLEVQSLFNNANGAYTNLSGLE